MLGGAIAILAFTILRSNRNRHTGQRYSFRPLVSLGGEIELFRRTLADKGEKRAILEIFPVVVDKLARHFFPDLKASKTMQEIVRDSAPSAMRGILMELYKIYEPVRFGNLEPEKGSSERFLDFMTKLQAFLT